jgi:UDP-N-acetylmuramate dehydrogenase
MENAGIKKGQSLGGARVSSKHVLALTNPGQATTREILALADLIATTVEKKYRVRLEREPILLASN